MAEKKTPEKAAEMVKEEPRFVEVTIPEDRVNGEDAVFLSVNGRKMLVKRGVPVRLPIEFYEVLVNSWSQDRKSRAYIRMMEQKMNEKR